MRRRRRKADDKIEAVAAIAVAIAVLIIITTAAVLQVKQEWQQAESKTKPEPLVITVAPRAEKGTITVYDYNGNCIYGYYGEITIENDGRNGEDIAITCKGYLEGYIDHTDD